MMEFLSQFKKENIFLAQIFSETIVPYFSKRGWFIAGNLTAKQIIYLKNAILNIKIEGVEQEHLIEMALVDYTKTLIDKYEKEIYKAWEYRTPFLKEAMTAHKLSMYGSSIHLFLTQSDGMCSEIFGYHIFTKTDHKSLSQELTNSIKYKNLLSLGKAFLELLSIPSGMISNTKNRDKEIFNDPLFCPLNRHGIIHGIDFNWANETNSLRCISLIMYLTELKQMFKNP